MTTSRTPEPRYSDVACQQILAEDRSVFSIQWIDIPYPLPSPVTIELLLADYLRHIERFTLSIVRPAPVENGLEFRLGNSSIPLLQFAPPTREETDTGSRITLRICGGILVQPKECHRGQLDFTVEQRDSGTRLTLQLSDFCPLILRSSTPSRWRRWLYRLTQAYIHKVVTIRFLSRTYRKLTGTKPRTRIVTVAVRKGDDI